VSSTGWLLLALALAAGASPRFDAQAAAGDWTQFGWDPASSGASTDPTGITTANAASLQRQQVTLDGTVDAAAIYLRGIEVKGAQHDVFFVTTTYGKTIAIDALRGSVLWEYSPPKLAAWEGSRQITTSTPAADPDRHHIYAAAPDGTIQKLAVADGHVLWSTSITQLPAREKIASPLREFRGRIIAVTTGYIGDAPPYQGHVAILDAQSGRLVHVWNSLCSDRARAEQLPLRTIRHLGTLRRGDRLRDGRYLRRHRQWALQRQDRLGRLDHRARRRCNPDARQLYARQQRRSRRAGSRHRFNLAGALGRRPGGTRGQGQAHPIARHS
jgi:PQQ-like domain